MVTSGFDEIEKYAAKQEVIMVNGVFVTNANGGCRVSDLPVWKLKRGMNKAKEQMQTQSTRDRLRAKLAARNEESN